MQRLWHKYHELFGLTILALESLLLHLFIFVQHGPYALGYDTGFYRRYLIEPLASFPNTPVPGLGTDATVPRVLFDLLRHTPLSPDHILYGTYLACFMALPILLYYFLKPRLGNRGAYIAGLFLVFSSVQYVAYAYMLWKSAFALCLLLGTFIAIERGNLWVWFLFDLLLALSHKTTALLYIATLGVAFVLSRGRNRAVLTHIAVAGLALLAVNTTLPHTIALATPVAVFLSWGDYIRLSLPWFLLVAIGWRGLKNIPPSLLAFAAVTLSFTLLHLPFYERVFIYSDVALAALAAYSALYLLRQAILHKHTRGSYVRAAVLCIAVGLMLGNLRGQIRDNQPLVARTTIPKIEEAGRMVPADATILTTSNEAPWFEGWTNSHIAAPGLLHDNHSLDEWTEFWDSTSTPEKIAFLKSLPHPLYISSVDSFDYLIGKPWPCLTVLSPVLLRDDCDNIKK